MVDRDRDWDFHLRNLSSSARDSNVANDPASDPNILQSVKRLYELCKAENSEDLVARVYPHFNKIFQRSAILQFFIDFGELVLHDADPSLKTFFRSCLSRYRQRGCGYPQNVSPLSTRQDISYLHTN